MAAEIGLTETLALLFALYFLAAGSALAAQPQIARRMLSQLAGQSALCYLAGILVLAIGGAVVGLHHRFDSLLAGFVTLIGWVALIEGLLLIALQERFVGWFSAMNWPIWLYRALGIATVLFGLVLASAALG